MILRKCSKCKVFKPETDFGNIKRRGKIDKSTHCKKCHAELHRVNYCVNMSDKYIERALREQGFINPPKEIIDVKRELLRLKRTIWQISKM